MLESAPLCLTELAEGRRVFGYKAACRGGSAGQTSQPRPKDRPTSISDYPLTTPYKYLNAAIYADNIDDLSKCFGVHLIDGITGSGKTGFILIR